MGTSDSPDEKVKAYYIFHRKIEMIIKNGYNPLSKNEYGEIKKFYIINNNFIDEWKKNSGYNNVKNDLDILNIDNNYLNIIDQVCDSYNKQNIFRNVLLDFTVNMDNTNKFAYSILSLKDLIIYLMKKHIIYSNLKMEQKLKEL